MCLTLHKMWGCERNLDIVGDRILPPCSPNMSGPNSQRDSQRDFADVIKLMILRRKDYFGGFAVITKLLTSEKKEMGEPEPK